MPNLVIIYYVTLFTIDCIFLKKKSKEEKNTENFSDKHTKTIKQKRQQLQGNLYTRRKCILKEILKGVFKRRTIIVSKSYFFLKAQLFTKKYEKTVKRDLFVL